MRTRTPRCDGGRLLLLAAGLLVAVGAAGVRASVQTDPLVKRTDAGVKQGLEFLRRTQQPDGSWQRYPGITAIAVLGFLRNGVTEKDPAVARAIRYLAAQAKPSGAIYTNAFGPAQALPNYNTSLSVLALHHTKNPRYQPLIRKAQEFLAQSQYDEGEGFKRNDRQYGGIGYGSREDNPDLSNLQQALEALKETDYSANAEVWDKALVFLQRCQNRSESNDQKWAGQDGGFVYSASGESKADEFTKRPHSSYGSMTYAGLKSYLYCNVSRKDPRTQSALRWITRHFSVKDNPNLGDAGLYYYYHTMSKALAVHGEKVIVGSDGKKHHWARELAGELLARQQRDGSWVNSNARWRENDPHLVTGFALISLANCRASF